MKNKIIFNIYKKRIERSYNRTHLSYIYVERVLNRLE